MYWSKMDKIYYVLKLLGVILLIGWLWWADSGNKAVGDDKWEGDHSFKQGNNSCV